MGESVSEAGEGNPVPHSPKSSQGLGPDPLGGRVSSHKLWMSLFQFHQLSEQGIVFAVWNLGIV